MKYYTEKNSKILKFKKNRKINIYLAIIITILMLFNLFFYIFDKRMLPTIIDMAEIKMESEAVSIINEESVAVYSESFKYDDIIHIEKDEEGNISLVRADTVMQNYLASQVVLSCNERFKKYESVGVKIPIGYLTNSSFFYNIGPSITVKMRQIGKINTSYESVFESAGIPQVKSVYVKKRNDGRLVVVEKDMEETEEVEASIMKELGMPCFIKASRSGSSVGCYRCDKEEDLMAKLEEAAKYDTHIVVEECVDCIELETAVLGNDDIIVSRVGQIMPHGEFYTFESKYEDAESKTCIPAKVDEEIQEQIRKYAVRAFKAIDGHGLSRVDFFLDKKTNHVYLNEINTLPGFTSISMYPQLMEDYGYSYSELLDKLIEIADEN